MSRTKLVPVLLLLVVGLVTACGGSDDGQAASSSESSTTAAGGGAATKSITIADFAFEPVMATAAKGDTIIVTNKDGATHTLTADDDSFDTGKLSKGSKPITLDEAGTFTYHCEIHSYMKGTIEVSG